MTSLRGKRLLVVEDEKALRSMLVDEFRSFDAEVDEADNGIVGLAMATSTQFDAVIADVKMPRGDGLTMAKALLAQAGPHPKIFLCSGDVGKKFRAEALAAGIIAVFGKPFDFEQVTQTVIEALASAPASDPKTPV